ncbi:MAG: ABC transporter permease [Candidatus Nanoarchaeia archaeon]
MLYYLSRRVFLALFTLFVILYVSYWLLRLAPGDPTKSSFFGDGTSSEQNVSAEKGLHGRSKSMIEKLHLDKPVYVGFALWMKKLILEGDFGDSVSVDKGRPVMRLILERLPVTLKLNILAVIVTYLFAIPIGIHSAITKNSKLDFSVTFLLFLLYSLPSFWIALLLQATLCEGGKIPVFPLKGLVGTNGWGMTTWQILLDSAKHYVLPVFCLSYSGFAGLSRFARAGMVEVIRQDYIRTARAKGLPEHIVILKHAFRNASITLVTLFAGLLPGLVSGSIMIEYIFNIPGMGTLSMLALSSRDIPLLMALFCIGSGLTLFGILFSDILYVVVDPRIRLDK